MAQLLSVNLAVPGPNRADGGPTGIDKQPATGPVAVRVPGSRQGGVVGDQLFSAGHGGPDQAVYAYAREDLDHWATELGRSLPGGVFGENLSTRGVDVTGALIGERWRIGEQVILEVSIPRIPCGTFATWMAEQGWVKRFTAQARPGAYLRVVEPGEVRAGDEVAVVSRPDHDVTIGVTFRALTLEPGLLPRLLAAPALPQWVRDKAARRLPPADKS